MNDWDGWIACDETFEEEALRLPHLLYFPDRGHRVFKLAARNKLGSRSFMVLWDSDVTVPRRLLRPEPPFHL